MSFYATTSYPELPTENPSLVVAFTHLLQNFGKDTTPDALAQGLADFYVLDHHTITAYDTELSTAAHGRGWPTSKNSIVSFQVASRDGQTTMLHCLIHDPAAQTIIDSTDGTIKSAGIYGTPLTYASYSYTPVPAPEVAPAPTPPKKDGRNYTVLKGDRLFTIAHKLGLTEQDLIDHNDLDDPYNLKAGTILRLPIVLPEDDERPQIDFIIYEQPVLMHIIREGGAQKWHFGKHDTVQDIISGSGMYAQNTEVRVYGQALVPVEGEPWAYYMDYVAVGDYEKQGHVRYTIGFACNDLKQGPAPSPAIDEITVEEQITQTIAAIEAPIPPTPSRPPVQPDEVLEHPNRWRSTYVSFGAPKTFIVDLPDGQDEILVHDHEQKRMTKRLRNLGHYPISGTFWKDGVEYGRPLQAVQSDPKSWYGIPMSVLTTEADMYDAAADLPTKLALKHHSLTPFERYVIPPLAVTSLSYDRLKFYGRKLTNKSKEKK